MKLLLVGGGGREHALAWKLLRDDPSLDLIVAPGNAGIATIARCVAVRADDVPALLALARAEQPDVTVVGPEAPLASGIVDAFRASGFPAFGPTAGAARIETSKSYAKELMRRAGVPTARATHHVALESALVAIRAAGAPVVIKASGLAAGKGVVVADSTADAEHAARAMLHDASLGDAGREILVEEFMSGEELSVFALTDGRDFVMMQGAQDHKRLLDGDRGPNTGGMGAYAPVSIDTPELRERVRREIFEPVLRAMREDEPFTGLLYAGLMLTSDGPRVVEFNCRFGDPETEAILPLLDSSLLDPIVAIARGDSIAGAPPLRWRNEHAVTTVVAAPGYPDAPRTGAPITLPSRGADVQIFHAGTRLDHGALVSAGGRVLAVTAVAATLAEALRVSAAVAGEVSLDGKQVRSDIGRRELERQDPTLA